MPGVTSPAKTAVSFVNIFLPLLSVSGIIFSVLFSFTVNAQYTGVDPAGFSTPTTNTTGTYFISWNSTSTPVRVYEIKQGTSNEVPINTTAALQGNISVTRTNGVYTYKFYYCPSGATNCGLWGASTTTVTISSSASSASASVPADPKTTRYTYDELGRLVKVEDGQNGNRNYNYDAAGNRTNVTVGNQ